MEAEDCLEAKDKIWGGGGGGLLYLQAESSNLASKSQQSALHTVGTQKISVE